MSAPFDPRRHRRAEARAFEDLRPGERFPLPGRTVTEAHFAAFQMLSADNHPIHYDVEYCDARGLAGPLAHGLQILCFTAAGAGGFAHVIGEALLGFIEQSAKFLKPVFVGDTLYPVLEIAALTPPPDRGAGKTPVPDQNRMRFEERRWQWTTRPALNSRPRPSGASLHICASAPMCRTSI